MNKPTLSNESSSIHCASCSLRALCMPCGMTTHEIEQLATLVKDRIRIEKGEYLFRLGQKAEAIYSIRTGSIKTQLDNHQNHKQITGFFLPGEVLGLDALSNDTYLSNAIALEDTEVCVMKNHNLDQISRHVPILQNQIRQLLNSEISRSHQLLLCLGSLKAEQRIATFLLDFSGRFAHLGYSSHEFNLRMNREDIGNFLGLTLETTSRILSKFQKEGFIAIQQKTVRILNRDALKDIVNTAH
ncbi:transcriptional regulator [Pelistega indica]|uniref:Transcriptional regulator n=2 Tax=Alcaligenaceae TaxID=506 RepID=V8G9E4_9BURK|nr:transcriptional regulator [Pelistega indica]